jgi:transcriptional regulator with XRE-family HTH domain
MPQTIEAVIGYRLRARRRLLGLTQKEVGERLGVTPQMVHKWEMAQCALYAATLLDLARALGVSPGYFFIDAEPGRIDHGPSALLPPED